MESHPTKHLGEVKLVSLLSPNPQHKLSIKDNLKRFPTCGAAVLNDSRENLNEHFHQMRNIVRFES